MYAYWRKHVNGIKKIGEFFIRYVLKTLGYDNTLLICTLRCAQMQHIAIKIIAYAVGYWAKEIFLHRIDEVVTKL